MQDRSRGNVLRKLQICSINSLATQVMHQSGSCDTTLALLRSLLPGMNVLNVIVTVMQYSTSFHAVVCQIWTRILCCKCCTQTASCSGEHSRGLRSGLSWEIPCRSIRRYKEMSRHAASYDSRMMTSWRRVSRRCCSGWGAGVHRHINQGSRHLRTVRWFLGRTRSR